jgi:hypothetical protein
MRTLIDHAGQTPAFVCSDDPADYAADLAAFQAQTAAWRALTVKPPLGDEAYKDRLLASDAQASKRMDLALKFTEDGLIAEPTWALGWYNAAVFYAEIGDEFDAAVCMKRFAMLSPDAPNIRTARDSIILWEAKAAAKVAAVNQPAPGGGRR